MNNKELQALRKLLMLEVNEAAEHVGEVRARTWYYWEEGKNPVPPEIAQKMTELVAMRNAKIENLRGVWDGLHSIPYFTTLEDYLARAVKQRKTRVDTIEWRISQSVAAHFYAEGMADLI